MTAITAPRKIIFRGSVVDHSFGVKASAVVLQSALVQLIAGYAIDGKTGADSTEAGTLQTVGVALETVTGTAADGGAVVTVRSGEAKFANLTGDLVTVAEIGKVCYLADNQTVAKTSNTNVRAIAGRVTGVDSDGVWVRVGVGLAA
ncbi:hypothetical protein ABI_08660 [Asticcacaulis biprosthecium C19]|uniref:Uncharacterized protein n=1 Tax=Asticcacaulis biprosthecium C19 TaxID=715226 RepID=F4QGA2_9CAUL|nr:hypothetical protein [Asticcacaulis biprosthecium]EGF92430.1 hypothetical protein ABI_08660 [Asticcacaulis biprosthecium C19]